MIDIGANLTNKAFAKDLAEVLTRARDSGLTKILVTGTDISTSEAAAELAGSNPDFLRSTVGVHPHHAAEVTGGWIDQLIELASLDCVVAVGETGLDFYRDFSPRADQIRVFEAQLKLAGELGFPVFVHDRDSESETLNCLVRHAQTPVVVHCFTGSGDLMHSYLEFGCYIGITGWVCDPQRGTPLQSIVAEIPDDRLLIETDAPYLLPKNLEAKPRNRRNEPAFLPYVVRQLAQLRQQSEEHIRRMTTENAIRIFGL